MLELLAYFIIWSHQRSKRNSNPEVNAYSLDVFSPYIDYWLWDRDREIDNIESNRFPIASTNATRSVSKTLERRSFVIRQIFKNPQIYAKIYTSKSSQIVTGRYIGSPEARPNQKQLNADSGLMHYSATCEREWNKALFARKRSKFHGLWANTKRTDTVYVFARLPI